MLGMTIVVITLITKKDFSKFGYAKLTIMKHLFSIILVTAFAFSSSAQTKSAKDSNPDPNKKVQVVEASCGECQFGMEGKSCDLAVRIDGKSYFVDGTTIDQHGDAHAKDGFCKAVRKAEVQREIVNNRFEATYFKLMPKE